MLFKLPKNVEYILECIHSSGEEAYIVGGCVRDILMEREPKDYDITTSAKPEHIKKLFKKTVDTGLEHGTVTVLLGGCGYEVTTYRIEGKYEDYRRPKDVVFTRSLKEDLLRRDFTINAMAYNVTEGLIDLYDGQADIEKKILRCVGRAEDRFHEDALRMLRGIRFSSQLGFDIEDKTYQAIQSQSRLISHVSAERIYVEMTKTLLSQEPWRIEALETCGLIQYILPKKHLVLGRSEAYALLAKVSKVHHLRWAMYLSEILDVTQKELTQVLKQLRFDNKTAQRVLVLMQEEKKSIHSDKVYIRRLASQITPERLYDVLELQRAKACICRETEKQIRYNLKEIIENGDCLTIKSLAIHGVDLIDLGVKKGPCIGRLLHEALEYVLDDPTRNQKEKLLDYIQQYLTKQG